MGSKKHKKESKKKKHRSRSRSPIDNEERERKRHKKHKDRKKDRSPDVEEVPVDSHLHSSKDNGAARSCSPSSSGSRDQRDKDRDKSQDVEAHSPPPSGKAQGSMSVEDTNKLRAKLGLKPLEFNEKPADDGKIKDDLGEFYHKPATNISKQRASEKIRERLEERKEKRKIEEKLKTTLLADDSDGEDASAWVKKSRDLQKQKQDAAKRAAMLDEMDEVFGVGALLQLEHPESSKRARRADRDGAAGSSGYGQPQLRGLRVAHDLTALPDERETVLTLADKEVLADDAEDVLVNVNIVDDERYKKNIEERKKAKAGYQAYDEEAEVQAALGMPRALLAKYDDELEPERASRERGFRIGDARAIADQRQRERQRRELLLGGPERRLESLALPQLRLASDYMDEHEVEAKFKKFKKRGKIRKKAKQEPIDVDEHEAGTVPLDTDDTDVKLEVLSSMMDEEEVEPDSELQAALARARRMRFQQEQAALPKVEEILERVKEEPLVTSEGGEENPDSAMVLDATAEFCRTLGDIPTYGLAGNRDTQPDIMDFERTEAEAEPDVDMNAGAWSRVDVDNEKPPDLVAGAGAGGALEAEPSLGAGVAGALRLACSKGYLERAGAAPAPRAARTTLQLLAARHYCIEDKSHGGEDDKYGRRERGHGGHSGPLSDFREKSNFRPNIKLEYVDDDGRPLCPKEAFRYLSHKFHGKGPGKNKQEKRIKKAVQEGLMKKMSSTDTPLGTLQMLQQKQKDTQSPFVLLSGTKREPNH